jgi:hypothetical protein
MVDVANAQCSCSCCRDAGINLLERKYDAMKARLLCGTAEFEADVTRIAGNQCQWVIEVNRFRWTCIRNPASSPTCDPPFPTIGSAGIQDAIFECVDSCLPCDLIGNFKVSGTADSICHDEALTYSAFAGSGSCDPLLLNFTIPLNFCSDDPDCPCNCDCCTVVLQVFLP